ncbi:MAG: winged helix-turn-helix transcriptional regulator [Sulfolobales archaeon]
MTEVEDLGRVALRIYLRLLESEVPLGVRELARDLNIPVSTVHYNLRKLEELGVISRSSDGYVVSRLIPLDGFVVVRKKLVPRLVIYALFFTGITLGELIVMITLGVNIDRLLIITTSSIASVIFFIEGLVTKRRFK